MKAEVQDYLMSFPAIPIDVYVALRVVRERKRPAVYVELLCGTAAEMIHIDSALSAQPARRMRSVVNIAESRARRRFSPTATWVRNAIRRWAERSEAGRSLHMRIGGTYVATEDGRLSSDPVDFLRELMAEALMRDVTRSDIDVALAVAQLTGGA